MKKLSWLITLSLYCLLSSAQNAELAIGADAPSFKLKNASNTVNGLDQMVGLEDYRNVKGYIVIFTCNHCPYSIAYEDRIINIHNTYALRGYPVVAINPNDPNRVPEDSYEKMIVRAKEKRFPFAYLHDNTQEIAKAYGATKTPHVFVVQKKKDKNLVRYVGAIDNSHTDEPTDTFLCDAIDALLSDRFPKRTNAKAFGCTIKWKR